MGMATSGNGPFQKFYWHFIQLQLMYKIRIRPKQGVKQKEFNLITIDSWEFE